MLSLLALSLQTTIVKFHLVPLVFGAVCQLSRLCRHSYALYRVSTILQESLCIFVFVFVLTNYEPLIN